MYYYPTVIIDDFFKDPLTIRKLAYQQETYKTSSRYSGERTDCLFTTVPRFADIVCTKILHSCGIPFKSYNAYLHFHTTGGEFGSYGWPHSDYNYYEGSLYAALIYLNLDVEGLASGTSIFKLKALSEDKVERVASMRDSFKSGKDNKVERENHYKNFEETVRVGGIFNRLVAYDGRRPHCGNDYFGDDKKEKRLTMIAFFNHIETPAPFSHTPIQYADMMSEL